MSKKQKSKCKRAIILDKCKKQLSIKTNNTIVIAKAICDLKNREILPVKFTNQTFINSVIRDFYNEINIKKVKHPKNTKINFYKTKEWRRIRVDILNKYSRTCLCCGAKAPDVLIHVDHIKPRSKYPELELDSNNLQTLCEDCNLGKSNRNEIDYRPDYENIGNKLDEMLLIDINIYN